MNNNIKRSRVDIVDSYVGSKLRARRIICGMSQEMVGTALNVSLQQIQKYEKGMNRISGSNLYRLTKFLQVPFTYFFEDIESYMSSEDPKSMTLEDIYSTVTIDNEREIFTFITSYNKIATPKIRKRIIDLVSTLSMQGEY